MKRYILIIAVVVLALAAGLTGRFLFPQRSVDNAKNQEMAEQATKDADAALQAAETAAMSARKAADSTKRTADQAAISAKDASDSAKDASKSANRKPPP